MKLISSEDIGELTAANLWLIFITGSLLLITAVWIIFFRSILLLAKSGTKRS